MTQWNGWGEEGTMQRVFRVVDTAELRPVGVKTSTGFNRNVRRHGIITPIVVAEVPDADGVIGLEIVDGNRRVRAAQAAGLAKVPAVVLKDVPAADRSRLTLICNHLRSQNFYTESLAVDALARDEAGVERTAKSLGLGVAKLLGIFRRVEGMPGEVRAAMYENRLPVSSAMSIATWPGALQSEVVTLLRQRHHLQTWQVQAVKKEYERVHGSIVVRTRRAAAESEPAMSHAESWDDVPPVPLDDVAPPATVSGWKVRPVETPHRTAPSGPSAYPGATATIPRPVVATIPEASPGPGARSADLASDRVGQLSQAAPAIDARAGEMEAFVKVLDATLRELAREGHERGIGRSVWVDRAMRAWDGTQGRGDASTESQVRP